MHRIRANTPIRKYMSAAKFRGMFSKILAVEKGLCMKNGGRSRRRAAFAYT